jgi:hypothetical protein
MNYIVLIRWAKYSISQLLSIPGITKEEVEDLVRLFAILRSNGFTYIDEKTVSSLEVYCKKYKDSLEPILYEGEMSG